MKVLHISPTYFPAVGGAEVHLQAISEALARRGHEVTVLTTNVRSHWDLWAGRSGNLPEKEIIGGVEVHRFSPESSSLGRALEKWVQLKGGWRSASWAIGTEALEMLLQGPAAFSLIPAVLNSRADIVAAMNWYWRPAYLTYLARKLKRFTLVGIPLFHTAQAWCERPIYQKMVAACDAIVVNTSYEGQFAQQRGAKRVEVAGVGLDPQAFARCSGQEIRARYGLGRFPVIGFVGRQDRKKGVFRLIEAMRSVWKWNKEVRLVLAGSRSPDDKDLDGLIANLAESQKARIINIGTFNEKDKGSLFEAFDVFALPSTEESFGIAYLEAWACGKAVIGARIGPTQCVIDEGVDGLMVDPHDPEDLAQALIRLLADRDRRDRMGRSGRAKTMEHYTWDKVIDRIERLYLDLATTRSEGRSVAERTRRQSPCVVKSSESSRAVRS
jgi:glycosyltransferase involved in cell wall biosynthesis